MACKIIADTAFYESTEISSVLVGGYGGSGQPSEDDLQPFMLSLVVVETDGPQEGVIGIGVIRRPVVI